MLDLRHSNEIFVRICGFCTHDLQLKVCLDFVGMTLLRTVIFPVLAVTQEHGRMHAVKINQIFCCFFQGDLFTCCRLLISIYDSVRQVQNYLG